MTSFYSSLCSVHTPTQNPPGVSDILRGDPPNDPPGDDPNSDFNPNSDFDFSDTSDAKDTDLVVVFANLAKAIKSLAKSLCCNPSETLQHTKV